MVRVIAAVLVGAILTIFMTVMLLARLTSAMEDWLAAVLPESVPYAVYSLAVDTIVIGLLALPGLISTAVIMALQRASEGEPRCRSCGYILRGLTEPRCPECGQSI